jgi:Putative metal-binding motif
VRDSLCRDRGISPELSWGGLGFRLALLDGPQAVRGFMAFLRQYRQSSQPPTTAEGRNDLYVEALAAGARRNLGCVADTWRWHISDPLRQRMRERYRAPNPDCQDRDRDGFSLLLGDCNDHQSTIHPGAAERIRRVDDDCDGRIDETVLREPAGGDFATPAQLTLPAEILGSAGSSFDSDEFLLRMKSPGRVLIDFCSTQEAFAQTVLISEAGELGGSIILIGGGCDQKVYSLSAGTWRFEVHLAEGPGGDRYSVGIQAAAPSPVSRSWARTAPPRRNGNRFVLTAAALPPLPGPPTEIRFWVSGQGIVGTVPYSRAASFAWTPPAGLDPAGLFYRAQILVRGVPAAGITRPQPFTSQ